MMPRYQQVLDVLARIMNRLAQLIVRDGEGATKFITVTRLKVVQILKNVVMLPIVLLSLRWLKLLFRFRSKLGAYCDGHW